MDVIKNSKRTFNFKKENGKIPKDMNVGKYL
jgi:hypothetical protein